jgi:hypothetical protein
MGTKEKSSGLAGSLFSRVQLRVLSLLIGQPDRAYQITDVIRLAGSGRGAVQRELEKLTAAGILTSSISGKRKNYQANRKSPIFNELYGLDEDCGDDRAYSSGAQTISRQNRFGVRLRFRSQGQGHG